MNNYRKCTIILFLFFVLMGIAEAQNNVYGSTNRVVIGLAIGRCLQRTGVFSDYQGATLENFLQSGKFTSSSDLDYVFSKAKTL